MIYRVLKRLSVGEKLGSFIEEGGMVSDNDFTPRVIAILVARAAILAVSPPPLEVLPGWKLRSKRFEEAGYDAINILEGDTVTIALETGYAERSIEKWKKELRGFMEIRETYVLSGCPNC
jgi:hypothetical protein